MLIRIISSSPLNLRQELFPPRHLLTERKEPLTWLKFSLRTYQNLLDLVFMGSPTQVKLRRNSILGFLTFVGLAGMWAVWNNTKYSTSAISPLRVPVACPPQTQPTWGFLSAMWTTTPQPFLSWCMRSVWMRTGMLEVLSWEQQQMTKMRVSGPCMSFYVLLMCVGLLPSRTNSFLRSGGNSTFQTFVKVGREVLGTCERFL